MYKLAGKKAFKTSFNNNSVPLVMVYEVIPNPYRINIDK